MRRLGLAYLEPAWACEVLILMQAAASRFCHWNHDGEALLRLDGADKPLHKEVPLGDGTFKIVDPEE